MNYAPPPPVLRGFIVAFGFSEGDVPFAGGRKHREISTSIYVFAFNLIGFPLPAPLFGHFPLANTSSAAWAEWPLDTAMGRGGFLDIWVYVCKATLRILPRKRGLRFRSVSFWY